jgi:hypothetical protein
MVLVGEWILTPVVQRTLRAGSARWSHGIGRSRGAKQLGPDPDDPRLDQLPGRRVMRDEERHRFVDKVRRQLLSSSLHQVEGPLQSLVYGRCCTADDRQLRRQPNRLNGVVWVEPRERSFPRRRSWLAPCAPAGQIGEQIRTARP